VLLLLVLLLVSVASAGAAAAVRAGHRRLWQRPHRQLDAGAEARVALVIAFIAIAGAGVVIGLLAYMVRANGTLVALDSGVGTWANRNSTPFATSVLNVVTSLGDSPVVPVLAVILAVVEYRRVRRRAVVPFLVVVLVGQVLLSSGLKQALDRVRPGFVPAAARLGPSFPSGHATTAAAFFAATALLLGRGRGRRARVALTGVAVGLAVAVAASRVLLDLHWLSDVVAGLALGSAWLSASALVFGRRLRAPAPSAAGGLSEEDPG
jgi:undecaprenyl-diphosphatase